MNFQDIEDIYKASQYEKDTNAEIPTPPFLRNDMFSHLPKSHFQKFTKTFEPCCGKGAFVIDLIDKYMDGLKHIIIEDSERFKFIIENCIYFADINQNNIHFVEGIISDFFSSTEKLKFNSYCGNSLEISAQFIKDKWSIDKFDLIITNPPYTQEKSPNKYRKQLFNKFVTNFIPLTNILCMITPSKWFGISGELTSFRKFIIQRKDLKVIKHYESENLFKDCKIIGGVSFFVIDSSYNGLCEFIKDSGPSTFIDLSKYDVLVKSPHLFETIDKIIDFIKINSSVVDLCSKYSILDTNDKRLVKEKSEKYNTKVHVSKFKGNILYCDSSL